MMDANESLVIDGEPIRTAEGNLIKKKGELLTLTGTEACELYGNPPTPLLGFGVFESVEDLLDDRVGENSWTLEKMEINWAEEIGLWLNGIAPLILSIGLVCIFVEFKTPGFGLFGVVGLLLLLVFFGSKYIAGLAGQEELLIFLLGTCLVLVEIFLVPGMIIPGLLGMILMVGGLFWAMVDIWPTPDFSWSMEVLRPPLLEMLQTMGLTICFGFLAAKILPKTSIWQKLILSTSITGSVRNQKESEQVYSEIIGKQGTATTELFPSGQIEVEGNRYDARSTLGKISKGERVEVIRASEFDIVVKVV